MAKKQNPAKAVADIRNTIDELKQQRIAAQRAPVTKAEAEAAIDRFIEHHADKYRSRGPLAELVGRGRLTTIGDDFDAVMAFYFPSEVKSRLLSELDHELADGTDSGDRRSRIVELSDAILDQERQEEQIILEAEEQGLSIQRRADANPAAVLDDNTE